MPARRVDGMWIVDTWVDVPGVGRRRIRKESPVQTKKGAQDYERELVESVLSSSERCEERRFDEFAIEFLERQIRVHCKYSTLVTYESALREHLVPSFGGRWLAEINEREIAAFQAALTKKGRSPKTVRNIVTVLSSALHTAKVWGYLDRLPEIQMPKPAAARVRFLSLEECLRLEEASTPSWQLMIHFARKTGLRIGELCALEWEQINFDNGTVLVDRAVWRKKVSSPTGNRSRIVDLSLGLVRVLREHRKHRPRVPHAQRN